MKPLEQDTTAELLTLASSCRAPDWGRRLVGIDPGALDPWIALGDWADFPWQLTLTREFHSPPNIKGGSSLVAPDWAVTSAHHFVPDADPRMFRLHWGSPFRDQQEQLEVERIVKHPGYRGAHDFDIALVQLADALDGVDPIALPGPGDEPDVGEEVTVSGWGYTEAGVLSHRLLQTQLTVASSEACTSVQPHNGDHPEHAFCASNSEGGGGCRHDSGGPASIGEGPAGSDRILVGSMSRYSACAGDRYNVFTRVAPFIDWIEGVIG